MDTPEEADSDHTGSASFMPEDSPAEQSAAPEEAENYRIHDIHLAEEGGAKTRFQNNVRAIRLLKELETEGKQASSEQQEVLAHYVGWGGIPDAFDEGKEEWKKEYQELKELLTPEEYTAARASTLNAHYTSPTVIQAIYSTVGRFGFDQGTILEPAMGIGNFFGMLPERMRGSRLYGVELDSISGRIAKHLYPQANITVAGFETTKVRNFYDLAVGNVPFGDYKVNDREYNALNFSIHNYFFAKAIDQVRPGGILAFVTSRYTMDAKNPKARKYIAQRADLLGAIRLPNNAFQANAGTKVVTDILFLQKRDQETIDEPNWVGLGLTDDGIAINSYFNQHPDMILGTLSKERTMYGAEEFTVNPLPGADLEEELQAAAAKIHGIYRPQEIGQDKAQNEQHEDVIPADPRVRNYSYTIRNGEVYYRQDSIMEKDDRTPEQILQTKALLDLRDAMQEVIRRQIADKTEEEITAAQETLNQEYDQYVSRYGHFHEKIMSRGKMIDSKKARETENLLSKDSSYFMLASLEEIDDNGGFLRKADIFFKRTISPVKEVTTAETPADALAVSVNQHGKVDLPYMAKLLGTPGDTDWIIRDLSGTIFRDPEVSDEESAWKTSDEYLSGNVRHKLEAAERAAEADARYHENVRALKNAQPKDLTAAEIDVQLGATWIDPEYIKEFMDETFRHTWRERRTIEVVYSPQTCRWQIQGKALMMKGMAITMQYGTSRMNAYEIIEKTLNMSKITIYDTIDEKTKVVNQRETLLAQQKQRLIKETFREWIWKDPDRRHKLEAEYNKKFNSLRPMEFSGKDLTFPGMNPCINLREHQRNAIAHILFGDNTLLAHEVGAGKTYTMAAAAMESKRLGLCRKTMIVVPNHLTLQWANEFLHLYPGANILVASKKDFEKDNRKQFCARIATGDYDAIIIGQSQFERIPLSEERQESYVQRQIDETEEAIAEARRQNSTGKGSIFTIKQMEKWRKHLESNLQQIRDNVPKDDVITFEQLGVDRLFVDEAQAYKNLYVTTKMSGIAGIPTQQSDRSYDMYTKCMYMDELTGNKGVVFATGTPISNSMVEMYTMMRYLQTPLLKEQGLFAFDAWASVYGETIVSNELAPEGTGYRQRLRFAKFHNLPELMMSFRQSADIKTADELHLPTPEVETKTIVAEPTGIQKELVSELSERAAAIHNGSVDPTMDNMLKITSDGRKIGLDQRLIDPEFPDAPESKVNLCVQNILRIYKEGKDEKLTQLVFCDSSTPKKNTFNIYDDIKTKLIAAGIPAEEIAFIHDAEKEEDKRNLFGRVNTGAVRILMGSTEKMGAGTNVQDRLIAVHHLDVGWRPADMTQRNGRIVRQGNMNPKVYIYNYVTEGTFDAYLWQTLENKQKFISQIMTSKSPVRSCDDVDEKVLSYSEVKALCAGDPRIKERMDLDTDVARLKIMQSSYRQNRYVLEDKITKDIPNTMKWKRSTIEHLQADIQTLAANPKAGDYGVFTIRGKTYADPKEAAKALLEAGKGCCLETETGIGTYRGFQIEGYFDFVDREIRLELRGTMPHSFPMSQVGKINLDRMEKLLNGLPERLKEEESALKDLEQELKNAKEELKKPFPQENELREKEQRLAELDRELSLDPAGGEQDSDAVYQAGVAEVEETSLKYLWNSREAQSIESEEFCM